MTKAELIKALQDDPTPEDIELFHETGTKRVYFRIIKIGVETQLINSEKKRILFFGT